ncbi:MAG: class I SAM-dependent methyltransferase [Kibdelosporangium sp.]
MDSDVSNLLYRNPELYETVYDGADHAVGRFTENAFQYQLGRQPESLLDIGCGTGRDLEYLARRIPDAIGVDFLQPMVDYARRRRPAIDFRAGDMRALRLGRTFEAITSFGWALANVHANHDIDRVMTTYATHSEPATMLVLEVLDPAKLDRLPSRFTIDAPGFPAQAGAEYLHDAERQLVERRRTWTVPSGELVHDSVRFRLLYPQELAHYLDRHGFDVVTTGELADGMHAASRFVVAQRREA